MTTEKKNQDARRFRIRKRSATPGDERRTHLLHVRLTQRHSAEVASIQGLCYAHGHRETIARLFEKVALPALREYVRPYADKAKAARIEQAGE